MEDVIMCLVFILFPLFISLCILKADLHYYYLNNLYPKFYKKFGNLDKKIFPKFMWGWNLMPFDYYILLLVPIFFKKKHENSKLKVVEVKIRKLLIKIWILIFLSFFLYEFYLKDI